MSDHTTSLPAPSAEYLPVQVWVTRPQNKRYWLYILMLLLTVFTTLVVGSHFQYNFRHDQPILADEESKIPFFPIDLVWHDPSRLLLGIPFSASLMLILLAHEMGHYLYCVHYGVDATLPFFIPFPTLIGTMGAFIRIRSPIRSRTALFDIGIAGPIAGFVVACGVLLISLPFSKVAPMPPATGDNTLIHCPLIFTIAQHLLISVGIVHGTVATLPFPRLLLHPAAIAAWGGMFATSLNLLPGGQLDGGHIVFSIAPRAHRFVSRVMILILIPMAVYVWAGWLVWAVLLEISSFRHPHVGEWPKVSGKRIGLAVFAFLMLVVTLTPEPVAVIVDGKDQGSLKVMVHEGKQAALDWWHTQRAR